MNPRMKKVLAVLGVVWGVPLIAVLGIGLWVKSMGVLSVEVDAKGPGNSDVRIQVPGAVAQAGLFFVPDVVYAEMADGMDEWGAVVSALKGELENCPDAVFVQVDSDSENVLIRKEGKHLVIDVDSDDETVHVRVPLGIVSRVLSKIDGQGGFGSIRVQETGDCNVKRARVVGI
jgi:hypothetical protein